MLRDEESIRSEESQNQKEEHIFRPTDTPISIGRIDVLVQSPESGTNSKLVSGEPKKLCKSTYQKLLRNYEEVEDMCCPICLD